MKKTLSIITTCDMLLSMAACGSSPATSSAPVSQKLESSLVESSLAPTETPTPVFD